MSTPKPPVAGCSPVNPHRSKPWTQPPSSFTFPVPVPGLLNRFAVDYGQPFQPKHFLGQFMDKHNPDAAARRAELGFESEGDAVNFFYGPSDWKDIPTPLLRDATKLDAIGRAVVPTLESHIVVEDNSEGRRLVANPYFHMVDTAGNQLPYINEIFRDLCARARSQHAAHAGRSGALETAGRVPG